MRSKLMLCVVFSLTSAAYAKDPKVYQTGNVVQMASVPCGAASKDADSGGNKTHEVLCQEYVLQGDHITYRIRPKDDKHPFLLPVGQAIQFRIHKDKLYLRDPEGDQKEREYSVVSMQMRQDVKDARNIQ